jgi:Plasmid pRiA4b ORF-3-like protein
MGHPNSGSHATHLSRGGCGVEEKDRSLASQRSFRLGNMSKGASAGRCQFCSQVLSRAVMTRHLPSCGPPGSSPLSPGPSFHLLVEARHAHAYWMHVALPVNATLSKLDRFLRETWLECCGHLSSFEIAGERYASSPEGGESGMKRPLQQVVGVDMSFSYEYDFGSTTELKLKVAGVRAEGTPRGAAQLLARNEPPSILCQSCGTEPAAEICVQCACDEVGWLCPACADRHPCEEEMRLPVTNSPRVGVCAYSG